MVKGRSTKVLKADTVAHTKAGGARQHREEEVVVVGQPHTRQVEQVRRPRHFVLPLAVLSGGGGARRLVHF